MIDDNYQIIDVDNEEILRMAARPVYAIEDLEQMHRKGYRNLGIEKAVIVNTDDGPVKRHIPISEKSLLEEAKAEQEKMDYMSKEF